MGGARGHFAVIDGLSGATGGTKAQHLEEHLSRLGVEAGSTVVIGDTPDDAAAARHAGVSVILYDGGSHHLPILEEVGAPIAHTLVAWSWPARCEQLWSDNDHSSSRLLDSSVDGEARDRP